MVLKPFSYIHGGVSHVLEVSYCSSLWSKIRGLMFRGSSPPLLFVFGREKRIVIHSFFCRPFRAFWLDENFVVTKVVDVKKWKFSLSGRGKYLLEVPLVTKG
jgi:uncharacterized membrane protein (UPF0127 family)